MMSQRHLPRQRHRSSAAPVDIGNGVGRERDIVSLLSCLSSSYLLCHTRCMRTPLSNRYKNYRFAAEIISMASGATSVSD
jgi:hypothetical protein